MTTRVVSSGVDKKVKRRGADDSTVLSTSLDDPDQWETPVSVVYCSPLLLCVIVEFIDFVVC